MSDPTRANGPPVNLIVGVVAGIALVGLLNLLPLSWGVAHGGGTLPCPTCTAIATVTSTPTVTLTPTTTPTTTTTTTSTATVTFMPTTTPTTTSTSTATSTDTVTSTPTTTSTSTATATATPTLTPIVTVFFYNPSAEATVTSMNGQVTLIFPPNSVNGNAGDVIGVVLQPETNGTIDLAQQFVTFKLTITDNLSPQATFNTPLTIVFTYDPQLLAAGGQPETNLRVYLQDDTTGQVTMLGTSVDTVNHVVTAYLPHLTTVSLAATTSLLSLPDVANASGGILPLGW